MSEPKWNNTSNLWLRHFLFIRNYYKLGGIREALGFQLQDF